MGAGSPPSTRRRCRRRAGGAAMTGGESSTKHSTRVAGAAVRPERDPSHPRRNHAMRTTSKKPARTKPEAKKVEAAPPPSRSRATPSARRSAGLRFACRSGLAASRSGRRRSRASSPRSARPIRITSDGLPPVAAACTGELLRAHPEVRRTATTATVTTGGKPSKSAGLFAHSYGKRGNWPPPLADQRVPAAAPSSGSESKHGSAAFARTAAASRKLGGGPQRCDDAAPRRRGDRVRDDRPLLGGLV
jgi:hypothetical protein